MVLAITWVAVGLRRTGQQKVMTISTHKKKCQELYQKCMPVPKRKRRRGRYLQRATSRAGVQPTEVARKPAQIALSTSWKSCFDKSHLIFVCIRHTDIGWWTLDIAAWRGGCNSVVPFLAVSTKKLSIGSGDICPR